MRCSPKLALPIALLAFALVGGCNGGPETADTKPAAGVVEPHEHGEDDVLVWELKEKIADTDYEVWLGHHGKHFHAGDNIEPAVALTLSGEPVADAKVFNWLVDPTDAEKSLTEEVATVFEPETEDEPAHYAQGELTIPKSASKCMVRFRVEIKGQDDYVKDTAIEVGH